MSACTSCGSDVLWLRTARGKRMPVDPTPRAGGNLLVDLAAETVEVHGDARIDAEQRDEPLHVSHFVSCPDAGAHRRRQGGGR